MALTIVEARAITGGAGTHADTYVAAALDPVGGLLGVREFPATRPATPVCGLALAARVQVPVPAQGEPERATVHLSNNRAVYDP